MSEDVLIKIRHLYYSRGDKIIFNNVDLDIPRGKIVAVMGPSGTGKTTLLQLIGGQLLPQQGHIHYEEKLVNHLPRKSLYQLRRKIGMLFQNSALFTNISVFDNVAFPLREHTTLPEALIHSIVLMKLEAVGLRGARALYPAQLSGGMARRVALARALALDPALIMYDEPFTGQDPISMGVLLKLIKEVNQALGLTSIIVSHDVPETASIADYIYIISEGHIVGQGSPQSLSNDNNPWVKQFMHGLADGVVPFHYPACDYQCDLLEEAR